MTSKKKVVRGEIDDIDFKYVDDILYRENWRLNKWYSCDEMKKTPTCDVMVNLQHPHRMSMRRIIYKLHNKSWDIFDRGTDNQIMNIDGDLNNNKIENLALGKNSYKRKKKHNAKGYTKQGNSYIVRYWDNENNTSIYIGSYATEDEAKEIYELYLSSLLTNNDDD